MNAGDSTVRGCRHTDEKQRPCQGWRPALMSAAALRLAENASLEDMVRFGVAAGSAATIAELPALIRGPIRPKSMNYLWGGLHGPLRAGGRITI